MSDKKQPKKGERDQGREHVRTALSSETEQEQNKLLEALRYSTVAIRLAVVYIKSGTPEGGDKRFGIEEYLKLYKQKSDDLTTLDLEEDSKARAMSLALQLSMDAISRDETNGRRAKEICQLLAYLATDKPIPMELFLGTNQDDSAEKAKVEEASKLLALYGVCTSKQKHQKLLIDYPIQQLIKKMYLSSEKSTLERGLKLLEQGEIDVTLFHHAVSVWDYCSKYPDLIKTYHKLVIKILSVPSDDYDKVMKFAEQQMKFTEKLLGRGNQDVMKIENAYMGAFIYSRSGGLKPESLRHFRQTLNKDPSEWTRFRCPLKDRFLTAIGICRQKKYREALTMLKDIYTECDGKPYLEKSLVLSIKGLIAIVKFKLGRTTNEDCTRLIKPMIVDIRASSQPDDPYSAYFKEESIDIMYFGGEKIYAVELFEEQTQVAAATFGANDPKVKELQMLLAFMKMGNTFI